MVSVTSKTAASIDASIAAITAALALKADLTGGRIPDAQLPADAVVTTAMTAAIAAAIAVKADLTSGRLPDSQLPLDAITTANIAAAVATIFASTAFEHDQLLTLTAGLQMTGLIPLHFNANVSSNTVVSGRATGDTADRFFLSADGKMAIAAGGGAAPDVSWGRYGTAMIGSTDADVVAAGLGRGFKVKEGTNARMGIATLVAGTVSVSNNTISANTRIFTGMKTPLGTVGASFVSAVTTGGSGGFTIKSTSSSDTSIVSWLMLEAA